MAYTLLSSIELVNNSGSITISSIPSGYKDLVFEFSGSIRYTADGSATIYIQLNSDAGSNYSTTVLSGNGTTVSGSRTTSSTSLSQIVHCTAAGSIALTENTIATFLGYSNTSTYKPVVFRTSSTLTNAGVSTSVGSWRSTSAINRIDFTTNGIDIYAKSTFKLWGVS